jgi:hypothetical protein
MAGKPIYAALLAVQQGINAPKDKKGYGYEYRTADGILQAAKPLLQEQGVICILSDESKQVGNRYYIKATAKLIDIATGDSVEATGEAVEPDKLASMAPPQITGTSSTYARKRALEGLFLLDNEKDVDSKEVQDAIKNSHQTAQNRPQGVARQNTSTNTNNAQQAANGGADAIRNKAIKSLNAEISRMGLTGQEVSAIAGLKFNKVSTKDMTTNEICQLTNNLESWVFEQTGASA